MPRRKDLPYLLSRARAELLPPEFVGRLVINPRRCRAALVAPERIDEAGQLVLPVEVR